MFLGPTANRSRKRLVYRCRGLAFGAPEPDADPAHETIHQQHGPT